MNVSVDVWLRGSDFATTEEIVVLLDYRAGKPAPVDAELRAAIHALEGGGAPPG